MLGLEPQILRGAAHACGSAPIQSYYQSIQVQIEPFHDRIRAVPARLHERIITPITTTLRAAPYEAFSLRGTLFQLSVSSIAYCVVVSIPLLSIAIFARSITPMLFSIANNLSQEQKFGLSLIVGAPLTLALPRALNFAQLASALILIMSKRKIIQHVEMISHTIDLIRHPEYRNDMEGFQRAMEQERYSLATVAINSNHMNIDSYPFLQSCKQNEWKFYRYALLDTHALIYLNTTITIEFYNAVPFLTGMIVRQLEQSETFLDYVVRTNDAALGKILLLNGNRQKIFNALSPILTDARINFLLNPNPRNAPRKKERRTASAA